MDNKCYPLKEKAFTDPVSWILSRFPEGSQGQMVDDEGVAVPVGPNEHIDPPPQEIVPACPLAHPSCPTQQGRS